jgi:hypothetical protein
MYLTRPRLSLPESPDSVLHSTSRAYVDDVQKGPGAAATPGDVFGRTKWARPRTKHDALESGCLDGRFGLLAPEPIHRRAARVSPPVRGEGKRRNAS